MRITGVVKGTEQDAVVAANKHGLQIKVLHVLADSVTVEFIVEVWETRIQDWFSESPNQPPFPAGTLLVYSHHGNSIPVSEKHQIAAQIRKQYRNYPWMLKDIDELISLIY